MTHPTPTILDWPEDMPVRLVDVPGGQMRVLAEPAAPLPPALHALLVAAATGPQVCPGGARGQRLVFQARRRGLVLVARGRPRRYQLTEDGRAALASHPEG